MSKAFLGARLRRLRDERKMTQQAVARALGISPSYYSQVENDERPPTGALLVKASAVFGVDVQLFSEERAFPPLGRKLVIDENASRFAPYSVAGSR